MLLDVNAPENLGPYTRSVASALELGQQRVKTALRDLTPAQLAATIPGLTNSIATLVLHICGTEVGCAYMLMGKEMPAELAAEYQLDQPRSPLPVAAGETVESLLGKMERARAILLEALRSVSEADADRQIDFHAGRKVTVRWVISLLPHHQGQHLGQIQCIRKLLVTG